MEKEKKIQFKKNLQIFLMIFIPYICFSSFKAYFLSYWMNPDSAWDIFSSYFTDIFQFGFLGSFIFGVTLILILIVFISRINLKEHKNIQFKSGMNAEDTSEKSPEPILYRILVAGKEIKFST